MGMVQATRTATEIKVSELQLPADQFTAAEFEELMRHDIALFKAHPQYLENELSLCAVPVTTDPRAGFLYWVTRYWIIEHKKTSERVRLKLNDIQRAYLLGRYDTNVILKERKGGMSTVIGALYYWRCLFRANQHAYILAHTGESTDELLQRMQIGHDNLPAFMRPSLKRSNKKELQFQNNGSHIRYLTAGGRGLGRGGDADCIHLSEAAWYADLKKVSTAIENATRGGAWIDKESTANGYNEFRVQYKDAKAGRTRAKAHFYPWFIDPTNAIDLYAGEDITPTDEEITLQLLYDLTPEQIKFRRIKKAENKEEFDQEYPEDDETCFLVSGVPKFNNVHLKELLQVVEHTQTPLNMRRRGPFKGSDNGRFTVWKEPGELYTEHRYVIGADVAEGLPGGAYSCAAVLNIISGEQMAEWHGHASPGDFGIILAKIGEYYNMAKVAVERNNHGHATLITLRQNYGNVYKHREYDQRHNQTTRKMGWPTNSKTRPQMFSSLRQAFDDGAMMVRSAEFLKECISMQAGDEDHDADNDEVRRTKSFKDRIFAWAIAWEVRKKGSPVVV